MYSKKSVRAFSLITNVAQSLSFLVHLLPVETNRLKLKASVYVLNYRRTKIIIQLYLCTYVLKKLHQTTTLNKNIAIVLQCQPIRTEIKVKLWQAIIIIAMIFWKIIIQKKIAMLTVFVNPYLYKFIKKMIWLPFQMANKSFCWWGRFKKRTRLTHHGWIEIPCHD